jgi:hypothetical protein
MEIFRYGHDAWGQVVVNGLSWSLLPVAFGAGAAVIVIHLLVRAFGRSAQRPPEPTQDGA